MDKKELFKKYGEDIIFVAVSTEENYDENSESLRCANELWIIDKPEKLYSESRLGEYYDKKFAIWGKFLESILDKEGINVHLKIRFDDVKDLLDLMRILTKVNFT